MLNQSRPETPHNITELRGLERLLLGNYRTRGPRR